MFSISFLVPKRKPLVYFVFHGKGKPHVLDQMHFAHVQSEVCFSSRLLKGESLFSRHKDPGYTISYLWPCQLSAAFARASCARAVPGGHRSSLCCLLSCQPSESPADLCAKSYWRWCCRGVPSSSISHLGSAPQGWALALL